MTPLERAVAEFRTQHPDDYDIPDGAIGLLLSVRQRAFGIACSDFWRALKDALA